VEFLTGWVANIILFILLATILDMLLPNSNLQRYVKMVIGLLLIVIILNPLLNFFNYDVEEIIATATPFASSEEKNIKNSIEFKKKEIQASNDAYILKQMAVQMKKEVEDEVMKQFNMKVSHVSINVDENIDVSADSTKHFSVNVQLAEENEVEEDAIQAIAEVKIDTSKPLEEKTIGFDEAKVVSYLAREWQLHTNQIIVAMEGGRAN
jgi:stage III sporulation protein AF